MRLIAPSGRGPFFSGGPLPQNDTGQRSSGRGRSLFFRPLPLVVLGVLLIWLFCLPRDLFRGVPYSTVVESAEGELLGARIADDGQWRFPACDTVPSRFAAALVQFEDRHFWWHPGVDPRAVFRALRDNVRYGHVVSGGSTITMQVIRLSRGRERTLWQKFVEAFKATRLEER